MKDETGLEQLLNQLDKWRNFAAYKLEQRIDPLVGICLPEILGKLFDVTIEKAIIPEFPLPSEKLKLIPDWRGTPTLRCDRIDYAAFSLEANTLYLIELKTDADSDSSTQREKLQNLAVRSDNPAFVGELMRLLIQVAENSDKRRKYIPILDILNQWGLIADIDDIVLAATTRPGKDLKSALRKLREASPAKDDESIEPVKPLKIVPVFIAPEDCIKTIGISGDDVSRLEFVSLLQAANALSGKSEVSQLLAEKLSSWNSDKASTDSYLKSFRAKI